MAKRTSKKKAATKAKKAPKKKAAKGKRNSKINTDPAALTDRHRDKILRELRKLREKPTHPTKHLGPVLPLDMGPPEKPKKRATRKKAVKRKVAKARKKGK